MTPKTTKSQSNSNSKPTEVPPLSNRRSVRLQHKSKLFGNLSADVQALIGWKILSSFDLIQQMKFRRISSTWDYNVRLGCRQIQSLVLHLEQNTEKCVHKFNQKTCNKYFNANVIKSTNKLVLNIREKYWKVSTFAQIGKLFPNVEHLTINEPKPNVFLLDKLVRQFHKITSFSLIISEPIKSKDFLSQLFVTINDHLAPLTTLDLYFTYDSLSTNVFPKLKLENCHKTLSYLQNFFLNCSVENQHEIVQMMGQSLPAHFPIQCLIMRVDRMKVSQIGPMFEHNPRLAQMKYLQLMSIKSHDVVDRLLDHFTELETLMLLSTNVPFDAKMIKSIHKLVNLKELELYEFRLYVFDLGFIESHLSVVRLKIENFDILENARRAYLKSRKFEIDATENLDWKDSCRPLIFNLAKLFPNLEVWIIKNKKYKIDQEVKSYFAEMCRGQFVRFRKVVFLN